MLFMVIERFRDDDMVPVYPVGWREPHPPRHWG